MIRKLVILLSLIIAFTIFALSGCDKERIVTTTETEYVEKIEYVESPPDTVIMHDTVFSHDSTTVQLIDTVIVTNNHFDTITVINTINHYDTVTIYDVDTVTVTNNVNHYDTITVYEVDTVTVTQQSANGELAFSAMQAYSDNMVLEAINAEFGITEGWVLYLSVNQIDMSSVSSSVYDIYGYIDYWTTDWSGFYAFEFYWRMTYDGGDPTNPANWSVSEPPGGLAPQNPGLRLIEKTEFPSTSNR